MTRVAMTPYSLRGYTPVSIDFQFHTQAKTPRWRFTGARLELVIPMVSTAVPSQPATPH